MQQYYQVPDLKNYDVRRLARKSLKGKWERALLPMILVTIALVLPGLFQQWQTVNSDIMSVSTLEGMQNLVQKLNESNDGLIASFLSFFSFLCTGAFSISAAAISIRVLRNEKITVKNAFIGFHQFVQGFLIDFLTSLFYVLWLFAILLPGMLIFLMCCQTRAFMVLGAAVLCIAVILYVYIILRYSMVYFIAQDNKGLPSMQVIRYSVRLMKGRAAKYFLLQLSFVGWILLSSIPMGAGLLFMKLAAEEDSAPLKLIGLFLILIGFLTVAMVQLYISTADGVFYSAVSGNFGLAGQPAEVTGSQRNDKRTAVEMIPEDSMNRQDTGTVLEDSMTRQDGRMAPEGGINRQESGAVPETEALEPSEEESTEAGMPDSESAQDSTASEPESF